MKRFIGIKMVEAEPIMRKVPTENILIDRGFEDGYKVRYPDGYESWSPKAVFEDTYLEVITNDQLRTAEPSISTEMVKDFIATVETITMGEKTTVVRAVLKNGFEIVESSSCVSAANYDEKLGESICMKKIIDKVWMLLGFLLQTAVKGISVEGNCNGD